MVCLSFSFQLFLSQPRLLVCHWYFPPSAAAAALFCLPGLSHCMCELCTPLPTTCSLHLKYSFIMFSHHFVNEYSLVTITQFSHNFLTHFDILDFNFDNRSPFCLPVDEMQSGGRSHCNLLHSESRFLHFSINRSVQFNNIKCIRFSMLSLQPISHTRRGRSLFHQKKRGRKRGRGLRTNFS